MDNRFPLYVRLDDGQLIRIDSLEKVLYDLEPIDIENDEYLFWDAAGNGVRVMLTGKVGRFSNPKVAGLSHVDNPISFQIAAQEWADQLGVRLEAAGSPEQVWDRLQSSLRSRE